MIIWGSKVQEKTLPGALFYCPRCKSDAVYQRIRVAKYFTLYFIPLFESEKLGEYVRCGHCKAELSEEITALTREEIEAALAPWTCASCGNQNPASAENCLRCGALQPAAPPPLPSAPKIGAMPPLPSVTLPAPKAKSSTWKIAAWIVGGIVALNILVRLPGIGPLMRPAQQPGKKELSAAVRGIGSKNRGVAQGNNEAAMRLAAELSTSLGQLRKKFISGDDSKDLLTKGEFVVYCQLNEDSCAFLIHVPALRRYADDAAAGIADLAYLEACRVLDEAKLSEVRRLAVATRGDLLYDRVRVGDFQLHLDKEQALKQPVREHPGEAPELLPFFAPQAKPLAK